MMVDAGDFAFGPPSPPPHAPPPAFPPPPGPHSYATLTPLQPLPPLNAIPEDFGFVSSDGYGGGNVSGSFTVMQANGPPLHPVHAAYPYRGGPHAYYDMPCEQPPPPPPPPPQQQQPQQQQHPQQCYEYRDAYCQQDYYVSVKTELHPHYGGLRESSTPPSPGLHQPGSQPPSQTSASTPVSAASQPPPPPQQAPPQPPPASVVVKSEPLGSLAAYGCGHQQQSQEAEEINTKELAQQISAELKRYSIPQAIFAQQVLCRSQGTLSDLLRNPKPWSKLKSGRETFRRMLKWLQQPVEQRMSSLRVAAAQIPQRAACKRKLDLHHHAGHHPHPALPLPHDRKQRLLFADLQRYF